MKKRENITSLLELTKEHPDLLIVPMVSGEIAGDDCWYWMADWGCAQVDEYLICDKSDYLAFRSDDDVFDTLERYLDEEKFDALPEDEDACREAYNNLPWTKAIIVWIETRDE